MISCHMHADMFLLSPDHLFSCSAMSVMTEAWVHDGKGAIRVGGQHFLKFQILLFIETELAYQGNASLSGWPEKSPIGL